MGYETGKEVFITGQSSEKPQQAGDYHKKVEQTGDPSKQSLSFKLAKKLILRWKNVLQKHMLKFSTVGKSKSNLAWNVSALQDMEFGWEQLLCHWTLTSFTPDWTCQSTKFTAQLKLPWPHQTHQVTYYGMECLQQNNLSCSCMSSVDVSES